MKLFALILSTILLCSCSFNSMFLHPIKLDRNFEKTAYSGKLEDSVTLRFTENHSPVFLHSSGDTVNLNYSITAHYLPKEDGDSINYWWINPKENYNGITILFLHGNSANLVYQFGGMIPFVERGYRVMAIDYSGFGFSSGSAKRKNVIEDARTAMDYLINDTTLMYDKLLIYGQSLGGHLSASIAAEYEEHIDGLVTEGAFASHKDVSADFAGFFGRVFVKEGYSGKEAIQNFNKPVLIIHSTEDDMVAYHHSQKLFDAANDPKTLLTIDKCHICGPSYYADTIEYHIRTMVK